MQLAVMDRVIETKEAPEVFEHPFDKSNVGDKWFNYEVSNYLGRWQGFYGKMIDKYIPKRPIIWSR